MIERRENVRYVDGHPFRDTPAPRQTEQRDTTPEWIRRAKLNQLPAKSLR